MPVLELGLSPAAIAARLGDRHAATGSDFDLNPHVGTDLRPQPPLRPAAVLVPLIAGETGLDVILTRRNPALNRHAGQIAFPGGRIDPDDRDPIACALREAEEEIGLARAGVEVLGELDRYHTVTGFDVSPVVARIRDDFTPNPDPAEVDEVFRVPLGFLLNPANHQRLSHIRFGAPRYFYAIPYDRHYIWGATAAMLVNFSKILRVGD